MRPYILAETNWEATKDMNFELAILPWGATEAHNYHLPYSTDNLASELIAAESDRLAWEKGSKAIVLPCVPFGVNTGQHDIYLDMNLNPSTQLAIVSDLVEVLNRQGIFKLLIFNGHGGNDFKPILRELGLKFPKMFFCLCNWYQALDITDYFEKAGEHAGELETSLVLFLRPDLVLPFEKWGEGKEKKHHIKAFSEGWLWTERKWSCVTQDTGIGNPKFASREKGGKYFQDLTVKMGNLFCDLCNVDIQKMYE
jgi:creatinine amidohydrolase